MFTLLSFAFVGWVIHSLVFPHRMCRVCKGKNGARIHSGDSFRYCWACKGNPKKPRVLTRLLGRRP